MESLWQLTAANLLCLIPCRQTLHSSRIDDKTYLDTILSICKENKIKAVLSLIDPELAYWLSISRNYGYRYNSIVLIIKQ